MTISPIKPLSVFYCYAHEDAGLRDEVEKHLSGLKRLGWIQSWYDRDIRAGADWKQEIDARLRSADLILLLVSADFLHSDYCYSIEMQEALRRHTAGEAIVIPIILRPVSWEDTPLGILQALPKDSLPITSWSNRDEALVDVAVGIQKAVKTLLKIIYVICSPTDYTFTQQLIDDLNEKGFTSWYTDNMAPYTAIEQENAVRQKIRAAHAVLLVASPHAQHARSIREELRIATLYQQHIVALWVAGSAWQDALPSEVREIVPIDAREGTYKTALPMIIQHLLYPLSLNSLVHPLPTQWPQIDDEVRNPFKGLRAFRRDDTRDFFGRDQLVYELVNALQGLLQKEIQGKQDARLLAVIGPSGSGKSSVVMSGLLPQLQRGVVADSDQWIYLHPIVPGAHPLEALALVLARELPEKSIASIKEDLEASTARGLYLLASQIPVRPEAKVVLFVDQFEELFTLTTSGEERRHFIDLLIVGATESRCPLVVLLTLRTDFYERLTLYPKLAKLLQSHHHLVLPMTSKDLRAVIEQPAALPDVNLIFERDLIGDLLFEIQGQAGALPLLQFTLDQLFRHRSGHTLTLKTYDEIGGVKGALVQYAESIYISLPTDEHRMFARFLFLRLVDSGTGGQEVTKRRATLSEFALPNPQDTVKLEETMNIFIEARLLMTNTVAGISTVEVSHETLIFEWTRFAEWLHVSHSDIQLQKSINEDAIEWIRHGKPIDHLYWGTKLAEAQAWAERNAPSIREVAFLQASLLEQTQQEARERAREVREKTFHQNAVRRQHSTIGIAGIVMVVMVVIIAVSQMHSITGIISKGAPTSTGMSNILCPVITTTSVSGKPGNCAFFISSGQLNSGTTQGIADQLQLNLQNVSAPQSGKSYYVWLLEDKYPPPLPDYVGPQPIQPIQPPLLLTNNLPIHNGVVHYTFLGDAQHNNLLSRTSRILITEEAGGQIPKMPSTDHRTWRFYGEIPQAQIQGDVPGFTPLVHIRHLFYNETSTELLGLPGGLDIWFFRNIEKVSALTNNARDSWEAKDSSSIRSQLVRILEYLDGRKYVQQDVPSVPSSLADDSRTSVSLLDLGTAQSFQENRPARLLMYLILAQILRATDISQNQRNLATQVLTVLDTMKPWLEKIHQDAKQLIDMKDAELSSQNALSLLNDMVTQIGYAYTGQNDPNIGTQRGVTWIHNNMPFLATFEMQIQSQ